MSPAPPPALPGMTLLPPTDLQTDRQTDLQTDIQESCRRRRREGAALSNTLRRAGGTRWASYTAWRIFSQIQEERTDGVAMGWLGDGAAIKSRGGTPMSVERCAGRRKSSSENLAGDKANGGRQWRSQWESQWECSQRNQRNQRICDDTCKLLGGFE